MAAGRMDEVEILEPGDDGVGDGAVEDPRTAARRAAARRVLRRWWPAAAAVVAVVVGVQVVQDSRADALADRLRQVDGVVTSTVSPPLDAQGWGDPLSWMLGPGGIRTPDGTYIGVDQPSATDPWSVTAADVRTGDVVWQVPLGDLPDVGSSGTGSGCYPEQEPVRADWCQVTFLDPSVGDPVGRLTRVDVEARAVTSSELVDGRRQFVAGGGLLLETTVDDHRATVRATHGPDGTPAWTTELPAPAAGPAPDGTSPPWPYVLDDRVYVRYDGDSAQVLDVADGRLLADGTGLGRARDGSLVQTVGDTTRLLGPDGTGTTTIQGNVLWTTPDDGSSAELLLVVRDEGTGGGALAAVDATTGAVRWEQPGLGDRSAPPVVLDGVVYGTTADEVWALDLVTGTPRWRTDAGALGDGQGLSTDGVSLLRVERGEDPGDLVLAAYRLRDGWRAWSEPLPEGVSWLVADGGVLFGWGDQGRITLQ